jgi:peptidoglycan hydrolase CwlO-like protein
LILVDDDDKVKEIDHLSSEFDKEYRSLLKEYKNKIEDTLKKKKDDSKQVKPSQEPLEKLDFNFESFTSETIENGKKQKKTVEKKRAMDKNGKPVTMVKTIVWNDDGTQDIHEIREDCEGKSEKKIKLDQENKPLFQIE